MGNVYVDIRLEFNTFNDFYKNRYIIKEVYDSLSNYDKSIYKMYVYSNRVIKYDKLHKIWEYLNEPFGSFYYVTEEGLKEYL